MKSFNLEAYEARRKRQFQEALQAEVAEKKAAQIKTALEKSGLINTIKTKTFDSYETQQDWQKMAKTICLQYAENPEGWLLVSGPSGCGKTHLCTAVVGRLTEHNLPVWYMLYREEVDKLKPMSGNDSEERIRMMNRYKSAGSLYIDDLFKGGASQADVKAIFELLDYRYRNNKRTIISTELSLEQLMDIDTAIGGRISELSKKVLIKNVAGRNYRLAPKLQAAKDD